ncbi:MAG: class I SAM-dependent methyltransferase [Bacteroidetes bacterium]|nr:class I SAM-dependent methyltransferase [Bacteroidota bacterium]
MEYDPIKRRLGIVFNKTIWLRKIFYKLLDLLLLRSWHVRRELISWSAAQQGEGQVLDAGSGFGQYSFYMANKWRNMSITGIDLKQEQINDCNQFFSRAGLNNAHFIYADLITYKKTAAYDLILCVDVMEHIGEDLIVLNNFSESLKKGGLLLISTPSDKGGSDVHEHGQESFIEEHVREGYNMEEIREKLKSSGFSQIEASYTYGIPGQISWRLSMKYPIVLLGISKLFFILLPFYYLAVMPFALLLNCIDLNFRQRTGTGLLVKAWR